MFLSQLALRIKRSWFYSQLVRFHVTTLNQLFTHTRASVVKQYNLVSAKQQWCSAAGKVTMAWQKVEAACHCVYVFKVT